METPKPICMVRDAKEIRPLRSGEQDRVTGFLLCGEGYGDMICMIPTVEKTAHQLGRTLNVWTKRPEVFVNIPLLRPRMSDDSELEPHLAGGDLLIVCPVRFDQSPKWNQTHLAIRPAEGIVQLDDADKEVRLYTTTEDRATAARLLESLGTGSKVVIHPNRNRPVRTWPSERWRQLALGLLGLDVGVVAVGTNVPNLADTEENIPKGVFELGIAHDRFLDLTGRTSLHELCEVIAASDVAVTFDSGVLHVANCTETPIVALFSDNDPNFFTRIRGGKPGVGTVAVHGPCQTQFCQTWHGAWSECLQEGDRRMCCLPSVEQVLEGVMGFLHDKAKP
ncbi:MAG TPA: glycosyltransferase family 9 protein [Verrucomicrobiota bacterium]|nr:glycosyltransferase family 9 protein [Verrucomicrobiota bacterium]